MPLLPLIRSDAGLSLSYTQVGILKSVFSGSSAVLQVPAGFLAEYTGEFWLLVGGNAWVALGLVVMALMPSYLLLLAASFIGGLGGGAQHPLASSMAARAYDDKGRSTAVGTINFSGDVGKMAAPAIGGLLLSGLGWRGACRVVGVAGVVFMAVLALTRRAVEVGRPPKPLVSPVDPSQGRTITAGFAALTLIGFLDSMARGGALAFLPFVMADKGMSVAQISVMLFLLFTGGATGKFICGWLGERVKPLRLIWWSKGLTAVLLILTLPAPVWALAPLMLFLGLGLNGTSSVLYAMLAGLVSAERRARMYGYFFTTNEGGSVIAPILYGRVADMFRLQVAVIAMGVMAALILPVSLGVGRYLVAATSGAGQGREGTQEA